MNTFLRTINNCPDDVFCETLEHDERTLQDLVIHSVQPIIDALGFAADPFLVEQGWPLTERFTKKLFIDCSVHLTKVLLPDYLSKNEMVDQDDEPQYFISKLDRVMKVVRHLVHHTGEIDRIFRQKNIEREVFV